MPSTFTIVAIVFVFLMIATIIILSMLLKKAKTDLNEKTTSCDAAVKTAEESATSKDAQITSQETKINTCQQKLKAQEAQYTSCRNKLRGCRNAKNAAENKESFSNVKRNIGSTFYTTYDIAPPNVTHYPNIRSVNDVVEKDALPSKFATTYGGILLDSPDMNKWLIPSNLNLKNDSWSMEYLALANPKDYWDQKKTHYNVYDAEIARNLAHRYCDNNQTNCNGVKLEKILDENVPVDNAQMAAQLAAKQNTTIPDDITKFEQLEYI